MFKQRLVGRLATLHRREACNPQFDDIGFAVEIFHQLAKGEFGQGSVILLGDGDARDLAVYRGIEDRDFDPGVHRFFHQRGGVGIASLRKNNAVVFLANRLVNEVLEFGVITVAEKGADFKAELFALLDRSGDKLGGVIVGAQFSDHRNANRPAMVGDRCRKRRRGFSKSCRRVKQSQRDE